jgi:hypothetical protein
MKSSAKASSSVGWNRVTVQNSQRQSGLDVQRLAGGGLSDAFETVILFSAIKSSLCPLNPGDSTQTETMGRTPALAFCGLASTVFVAG